jgi:hypothetical protein
MWHSIPRTEAQVTDLCSAVADVWRHFPHLRLGQLIVNAVPNTDSLFNLTDDELIKKLCEFQRASTEK